MASPIGHALAGIAVAWGADLIPGTRAWRIAPPSASWYERAGNGLTLACAVLAAAPDLDLFFGRFHRTMTHSFFSVAIVAVVAAVVAARAQLPRAARAATTRIVFMCAGAWATHLLLDWLSADQSTPRGIQLLWPFDGTMVHFRVGRLPRERTASAVQRGDHEKERRGDRPGRRRPGADRHSCCG